MFELHKIKEVFAVRIKFHKEARKEANWKIMELEQNNGKLNTKLIELEDTWNLLEWKLVEISADF